MNVSTEERPVTSRDSADRAQRRAEGIGGTRPPLSRLMGRPGWVKVLAASVVVALLVFAISSAISPTYSSSSEVLVSVTGQSVQDTTLGANNLADQYAQTVNSSSVLNIANQIMGEEIPSTAVSGGTVGAQNIVGINATGSSASLAQRRAAAVTTAFIRYTNQQVDGQATNFVNSASSHLSPIDAQITAAEAQLAKSGASPDSTQSLTLQQQIDTLLAQRASAQASIAQASVGGRPSVSLISSADGGSQTAPNPTLYALVGFLVSLVVFARVAVYLRRRGATAAPAAAPAPAARPA